MSSAAIPEGLFLAGKLEPVEYPQYYRLTKTGGNSYVRTWRGFYLEVQKLANALWAAGDVTDIEYRQSPGETTAELIVTVGRNPLEPEEVPVDNVELTFQEAQASIFTCRNSGTDLTTITDLRASWLIQKKIELETLGRTDGTTQGAYDQKYADLVSTMTATELTAFNLLIKQVDMIEVQLPVVVHTRTVSRNFPVRLSLSTTGMVFTTQQVVNAVGEPALFSIPEVANNVGARDGFRPGWLKTSQMQWLADGNGQLIETYRFRNWSNDLYQSAP